MAIFTGKIVSAKFIDSASTTIEILYKEGDEIVPYNLRVDYTDDTFHELLSEITLDEIEKNTRDRQQAQAKAFNDLVEARVNELWEKESEKIAKAYEDVDRYAKKTYEEVDRYAEQEKVKKFGEVEEDFKALRKSLQEKYSSGDKVSLKDLTGKDLLEIIESNNQDNDFVFNLKVSILEDPIVAKSKDKQLKLSLRKAKSVWQLMKIYAGIKEDS